MRIYIYTVLAMVVLAGTGFGCALLGLQTAPDGTVSTPLTDAIGQAGSVAQGIGMFVPVAAPIGGLLALLGAGILRIVSLSKKSSKLETALGAVVEGVNVYAKDETRIKELVFAAGADKEKIETVFNQASKVKRIIQTFATDKNIEGFLKLFIKTSEAKI